MLDGLSLIATLVAREGIAPAQARALAFQVLWWLALNGKDEQIRRLDVGSLMLRIAPPPCPSVENWLAFCDEQRPLPIASYHQLLDEQLDRH